MQSWFFASWVCRGRDMSCRVTCHVTSLKGLYVCLLAKMPERVCICVCVCLCTYVCVCARACLYTRARAHTHTHTQTQTHTHTRLVTNAYIRIHITKHVTLLKKNGRKKQVWNSISCVSPTSLLVQLNKDAVLHFEGVGFMVYATDNGWATQVSSTNRY